ncbi:MAG: hypothetical protein ABIU05_28165 [Nitrospirales bacterium]
MGRRRGFLPPVACQQCAKAPLLGQFLWPGDQWLCTICMEQALPGKDSLSKSMNQMIDYAQHLEEGFALEAEGKPAEESRNRAEWAKMMAAEIRKQGTARAKDLIQPNGEAVPPFTDKSLHDVLATPDLPAVEATLDRNRLLLQDGLDVAAMAVDAALSIQASNSLEKMLAHQLAATHKQIMELMAVVSCQPNADAQVKRINAAARCMAVYQQGMLALHRIRQKGQQRIMVQYVNVSQGNQAVTGNIEREAGREVESQLSMPTR